MLDTNAYVALKRGDVAVAEYARRSEELLLPYFVIGELLFGFRNGRRYRQNVAELEEFVRHASVTVPPVTWATTDRFGRIASTLRREGTPIPTNDIWIAAQAMETGAELLTFDDHFERIPGLAVVTPE